MEVTHENVLDWIKSGYAMVKNRCVSKDTIVVFCVDLFVYKNPRVSGAVARFRYDDDLVVWMSCLDGQDYPWGKGRLIHHNIRAVSNILDTMNMPDTELKALMPNRSTPAHKAQSVEDRVKKEIAQAVSKDETITSGLIRLTRSIPIWSVAVLQHLKDLTNPNSSQRSRIAIEFVNEIIIPTEFWDCLRADGDWPVFAKEEADMLSGVPDEDFEATIHRLKRTKRPLLVSADRLWETINEYLPMRRCTIVPKSLESKRSNNEDIVTCIASLQDTINWLTMNEKNVIDDDRKCEAVCDFIKDGYIPFANKLGLDVWPSKNEETLDDSDFHSL